MEMAILIIVFQGTIRGDKIGPSPTDIENLGTKRLMLTDKMGIHYQQLS
jgi:hypothetical protein